MDKKIIPRLPWRSTVRDWEPRLKQTLLSGAFCLAAIPLMAAVLSSTSPLTARDPGNDYTSGACGEYSGPLCKTVEIKSCIGSSCTTQTDYYYYSTVIE